MPTSYSLDVTLAASCPAPRPALLSVPVTRIDDPLHALHFFQSGRANVVGTTVFDLVLNGSTFLTGSVTGVAAATTDTGSKAIFSSSGAGVSGSGSPSRGYVLTVVGAVNYCTEFAPAGSIGECVRFLSCDSTHTVVARPLS